MRIQRLVERCLQLRKRDADPLFNRVVALEPLAVRLDERPQLRLSVGLHDVINEQRRFVVRERDGVGTREPRVEVCQLQRLASLEREREGNLHLASPIRTRLGLLVLGDPFGQPSRDPLIGHLERDDVRHLVP